MKKILSVLCVTFFSFGAFAQNAKYKEFFNAAKSYEQKKQYVYAMGSYLDAISVDPLNSLEAVENYLKLEEVIKSGKPGYGEFSVFELQSGWKDLLIDAEKYWTENFPYEISFGKWEVIDHDYATKTANYRKKIKITYSEKYVKIMEILGGGYNKAYIDDWSKAGMPGVVGYKYHDNHVHEWGYDYDYDYSNWPCFSVSKIPSAKKITKNGETYYQLVTNQKSYLNNGVAVSSNPLSTYEYDKYGNRRYTDVGIWNFYNSFCLGTYDIVIKLVDDNNKIIQKSKRYLLKSVTGTYDLYIYANKVSEKQMSLYENQKIKPVIEGIYLQYGWISVKDWTAYENYVSKPGDDEYTKYKLFKMNLPEFNVSLAKATFLLNDYNTSVYNKPYYSNEIGDNGVKLLYLVLKNVINKKQIVSIPDTDDVIVYYVYDKKACGTVRRKDICACMNALNCVNNSSNINKLREYYDGTNDEQKLIREFVTRDNYVDIMFYIKKTSPEERAKIIADAKELVNLSKPKVENYKKSFAEESEYYGIIEFENKVNALENSVKSNAVISQIQSDYEKLKSVDVNEFEKKLETYSVLKQARQSAKEIFDLSNTQLEKYKQENIQFEKYQKQVLSYQEKVTALQNVLTSYDVDAINVAIENCKNFDVTLIDSAKEEFVKLTRDKNIANGKSFFETFGLTLESTDEKINDSPLYLITAVAKGSVAAKNGFKEGFYFVANPNCKDNDELYVEYSKYLEQKQFDFEYAQKTKKGFAKKGVKIKIK